MKFASRKVVHKIHERTGEFIGNNIPDKFVKPKPAENSRNVEEIVILLEKRNTK